MAQVYLAAPFFDPAQTKRLNQVLTALNENESVSGIFSPRDDTNKAGLTEIHQLGSDRFLVKTFAACTKQR